MGETRLGEEGCMKKRRLIIIVMILTISAMLVACKSEKNGEENGTTTAYFEAVVEEVNDTVLLVDALESESNITGEITVPIDNSELYKVGDKIGVAENAERYIYEYIQFFKDIFKLIRLLILNLR